MIVVLAASLGLARFWSVTHGSNQPSATALTVGGLRFVLDGPWIEREATGGWLLIDERRPTRRVRIAAIQGQKVQDTQEFLRVQSKRLFGQRADAMIRRFRLTLDRPPSGAQVAIQAGVFQVLEPAEAQARPAPSGDSSETHAATTPEPPDEPASSTPAAPAPDTAVEQHVLAAITFDGLRVWLIHLTDRFDDEASAQTGQILEYNELFVRGLARRATPVQSATAPSTSSPEAPADTTTESAP